MELEQLGVAVVQQIVEAATVEGVNRLAISLLLLAGTLDGGGPFVADDIVGLGILGQHEGCSRVADYGGLITGSFIIGQSGVVQVIFYPDAHPSRRKRG